MNKKICIKLFMAMTAGLFLFRCADQVPRNTPIKDKKNLTEISDPFAGIGSAKPKDKKKRILFLTKLIKKKEKQLQNKNLHWKKSLAKESLLQPQMTVLEKEILLLEAEKFSLEGLAEDENKTQRHSF